MVGPPFRDRSDGVVAIGSGASFMPVELNPVFLILVLLLMALLSFAFVRRVGWKGWLVLGGLSLACVGTNPGKAEHVRMVQRQARAAPASAVSTSTSRDLMAQFKSGQFESFAEYHHLGIASVVSIQGKVLSFGVLGRVWVVKLQRVAHRPRRDVVSYRGHSPLAGR